MQTLYFKEKGVAQEVLKLGEKDVPPLRDEEIRVKMLASPINPADFMFIEKQYRIAPEFPQIAGFEGVGVIIDNGGDKNFPLNSLAAFRHKNAWAEFVNVPKDQAIPLPEGSSIEKAAQISLNPLTAWALLDETGAKENEWLILSAGNSAVSKLIIQLAKNRNIKTMPIIRDIKQKEELLNLGASMVLTYDNIAKPIIELAKTKRISGFLDAVGGDLTSTILRAISANSKIIHYGLYSENNVSYHSSDVIFKNLTIKGFGIDSWSNQKSKSEMKTIWTNLIREVMKPEFKMGISRKYSLCEYEKAILEGRNSKNGKTLFWME